MELKMENKKQEIKTLQTNRKAYFNYEVLEDKTGFMAGDTPAILDIAMEQNLWVKMGE